ncbi:MAG: hypothetical protein PSV13_03140 [Lacunisphaera sp.]|nr:hypothetical protein [Lacunisphaera sp.]
MKFLPENVRERLLPIVLSQGIGLGCGIAGVRLTSYLVDPADFGHYGVFTSLIPVGSAVIYIGLVKFISRHWQAEPDRPGLLRQVLHATVRKLPWLVAAAVVAAVAAAPGQRILYGLLFFVSAYLLSLTGLAQVALQAAREHWRDLGVTAGQSVGRSFLPPLLYHLSGAGLGALLAGFLGHAVIGVLLGAGHLRRWFARDPAAAPRPELPPHYAGRHFIVPALAGWILLGLNRWLVLWFFGAETSGYFTLAGNIGLILPAMLSLIMQQYHQPGWFAADHASRSERLALLRRIDRTALLYTALALGLTGALQAGLPLLVGPVIGIKYQAATGFVLATGFSTTALSLCSFYHLLLLSARREAACTRTDLSGALCLVAGSVVAAAAGVEWFKRWLLVAPLVPWLVNRSLARRALLQGD